MDKKELTINRCEKMKKYLYGLLNLRLIWSFVTGGVKTSNKEEINKKLINF